MEHSVATSGASAAAAGARGAGKSAGGVFRGLSETLDKARAARENRNAPATAAAAPISAPPKQAVRPVPASKPIDLTQVTEGLDRDELIARIGEPVLQLSEKKNSQLVERLWYNTTVSDQLEIQLIGGKVASIRPPAGSKREANPSSPIAPPPQ